MVERDGGENLFGELADVRGKDEEVRSELESSVDSAAPGLDIEPLRSRAKRVQRPRPDHPDSSQSSLRQEPIS